LPNELLQISAPVIRLLQRLGHAELHGGHHGAEERAVPAPEHKVATHRAGGSLERTAALVAKSEQAQTITKWKGDKKRKRKEKKRKGKGRRGKERKGKERKGKKRKGKEGKKRKGKERKGKKRKGKERKGKERKGKERNGKERKGKKRKGKERKGKKRKGKERKGKERKGKVPEEGAWADVWVHSNDARPFRDLRLSIRCDFPITADKFAGTIGRLIGRHGDRNGVGPEVVAILLGRLVDEQRRSLNCNA
jgi:hypothetical protein